MIECASGNETIDTVSFSYQSCLCDESSNEQGTGSADICADCSPLVDGPVDIECFDAANPSATLTIEPSQVSPEGVFSVTSSGGSLPDKINCTLSNPDNGEKIQWNVIDVSGSTSLSLKDKFGAMTLESCDEETCIEELCYSYTMENVGSSDMTITRVFRDFDGETSDIVGQVETNPLAPGESTSIEEKRTVDVCMGGTFCATVDVEAEPPNGEMCQDNDTFKFTIDLPPTPAPTPPPTGPPDCEISVNVDCTLPNGAPCNTSAPLVGPCTGRPFQIGMLLRGGTCEQSDNIQPAKYDVHLLLNSLMPAE